MRHVQRLLILLVFIVFLIVGCGQKEETVVHNGEQLETLRVLYSDWPPDMMVYLANEQGFFQENGVNVELVRDEGLTDAATIRQNQDIDIWAYPLLDFLTEYADGTETDAEVFMIEDYSEGADALISYELASMGDLVGQKVGVERGTVGEFFLNIVLEDAGVAIEDVELVNIPYDDIPAAVEAGDVAAGVTYEPDVTAAVNNGAVVLIDSAQARRSIVDVFVANGDDLRERSEAYKGFAAGINDALVYFEENPEAAADVIKAEMGMTTNEVIEAFATLDLPTIAENEVAFNSLSGSDSLYNLARQAQLYLEEQGLVDDQFDIEPLIYAGIVTE